MIKRINFFGESSSGKSTLAAKVYSELKSKGYNVELAREEIKLLAYKKQVPKSFQQLSFFARQINVEDELLAHVDMVISDSPIHLNVAYSKYYNCSYWPDLLNIANKYESFFPSINFWCYRKWRYVQKSRFQNEEESTKLAEVIKTIAVENLSKIFFDEMKFEEVIDVIDQQSFSESNSC